MSTSIPTSPIVAPSHPITQYTLLDPGPLAANDNDNTIGLAIAVAVALALYPEKE